LATRQKALWLLRTAGTGLVLTGAFVAAIAVGLVAILSLGGVLSLS
jgi:NAD(P)H-hydrate repair Nnr-like enzyme with NAD(P)H-hydrate dehydratase domain